MAEARIAFLTRHDPLTGLPNRWHATSLVQASIDEITRELRSPGKNDVWD